MSGYHQTCLERCPNLCTNSWSYNDQGTWKFDSSILVSCGKYCIIQYHLIEFQFIYYNNLPINLLTYFYIPFLATCPEGDGYTDQDDLEIYCGEEACQPCTSGKRNVYFTYFSTKKTLNTGILL